MEEKISEALKKLSIEECEAPMERLKKMIMKELEKKDVQLAEGVLEPLKSMATCWKHIVGWARKKAVNNCAMIEDADVLSEAIHYFIDVAEKEPLNPKPVTSKPKCTPDNRPQMTTPSLKPVKEKAEDAIISLF